MGGQPIAMMTAEKADEVLQIHSDHLGTPRAVTDSSNTVLWRMEGDQFGSVQPQVAMVKLPLRHAGQYADDETGLFYNYFRFYDPATGRYVTSDPIGLQGGMNTYGYVGGSPLGFVDPKGLNPAVGCMVGAWGGPVGCGVGAIIGGLAGAIGIYAILATLGDTVQDSAKPKAIGDDFAIQTQYLRYKDFCNSPPPPTGDRCQDLKNKIDYHKTCADMRETWDNKFFPNRHTADIQRHRRRERLYRKRLANAWECREQCDD